MAGRWAALAAGCWCLAAGTPPRTAAPSAGSRLPCWDASSWTPCAAAAASRPRRTPGADGLLLDRGRHQDRRIDQLQIARSAVRRDELAAVVAGRDLLGELAEGSCSIAAGVDVQIDQLPVIGVDG